MADGALFTKFSVNATGNETEYTGNVTRLTVSSHYIELMFILIFVLVWIVSIINFILRWNHIRLLTPVAVEFKLYSPKNLDTITVVKEAKESVIYCK